MIINNLSNDIEFYFSATERQTYPKLGLRTKVKGNYVIITSFNGGFAPSGENAALRINYLDVTSPVVASATALSVIIMAYAAGVSLGGSSSSSLDASSVYSTAGDDFTATPTVGAKTITITGLPFILERKHVVSGWIKRSTTAGVVTNVSLANVNVSGGVITVSEETSNFITGDEIIMALGGIRKSYDKAIGNDLAITQNPNFAHTTSVEILADEADIVGSAATADAGADTDDIVDADGAFTVANHAVGYRAWQTADNQSALITAVDSATNISTEVLSGAATWQSKAYRLPLVKRYEINMDTYNFLTIQYYLRNAVSLNSYLLLYGTLNAAATIDSDTGWINLSESHLGSATGINCPASTTLEDIIILDTPQTMLKYMVKLVVECSIASAPDNDYEIYIKKSS